MTRMIEIADFEAMVGKELGVSEWFTIDQARIDQFAEATGDLFWIHTDVERATRERGGTIAHGYLTLSMIPHLSAQIVQVTGLSHAFNYGVNKVRFTGQVGAGKRIRLRQSIRSVSQRGAGTLVSSENIIEVEGEADPVCFAEVLVLYFPEKPAVAISRA